MTPEEQNIFNLVRLELKPEMISQDYQGLVNSEFCGHCHHATLAMYELLGGKENGYKVRKAIDELGIKHYWLESANGEIIDPTAEQYTALNRELPYSKQVKVGISYRKTKHAKFIIHNIRNKIKITNTLSESYELN